MKKAFLPQKREATVRQKWGWRSRARGLERGGVVRAVVVWG